MLTRSDYQTLNHDWEKTLRLMGALERYRDILTDAPEADAHTTEVISVALENIDPEFDIKEGSAITLRAIKEAIVKAAKVAWEIFKQVYQYLNALYVRFTGSIRKVRANQVGVMARLGKLGSKTSYSSTISVAGLQRLSIDGKFVGTDTQSLADIKEVTDYILNRYPRCVMQIARNSSRQFLNILDTPAETPGNLGESVIEAFANVYGSNFREPQPNAAIKQGEVNGNFKSLKRSAVLAGNHAFVYIDPKAILETLTGRNAAVVQTVSSSLYMNFQELTLNVADKSERDIELPTVQELISLSEEISRILSLAEKAESGRRDFVSVKTVVDDAIRQVMDKTDDQKLVPVAQLIMGVSGAVSKKLAEPMDNYLHWLAITLNVWVNFIGHCVTHYEKDGV